MIRDVTFKTHTTGKLVTSAAGLQTTITPLDVPSIQRPFVWSAAKVCALADSLYRGYPIGYIVTHKDRDGEGAALFETERTGPVDWIVDGQQRVTALCILAGRTPHWAASTDEENGGTELVPWEIVFNPIAEKFEKREKGTNTLAYKVSTSAIWSANDEGLDDLARRCKDNPLGKSGRKKAHGADKVSFVEVRNRLAAVQRGLREATVGVIEFEGDHSESLEIFKLLNQEGVRLASWDLVISVGASRYPDWTGRARVLLANLRALLPSLKIADVLRPFVAFYLIGSTGRAGRLQDALAEVDFNDPNERARWDACWQSAENGWLELQLVLEHWGLGESVLRGTHHTYLAMVAGYLGKRKDVTGTSILEDMTALRDLRRALLVMLANRRYTSDKVNSIDKCVNDIRKLVPCNTTAKLERFLLGDLAEKVRAYTAEDFLVPYSPSAPVKLAWALYCHDLPNWATSPEHPQRVDCREGAQSHEIFPKRWLSSNGAPEEVVLHSDSFAARTFISAEANKAIGAKSPATYLKDVDPAAAIAHGLDYSRASVIQASHWNEIIDVIRARAETMAELLNSCYMTTGLIAPIKRKQRKKTRTSRSPRGKKTAVR